MGWSAHRATGLTYHQPARSFKGYTLLTPTGGDSTYLLDMEGRIVHRWRSPKTRPFYGRLLANGNLLLLGTDALLPPPPQAPITEPQPPFSQHIRRLGGGGTHLHELDWDGAIVWEYANEALHHDFIRLPNGNTLIPLWVELPDELARRVRGGVRRPREKFPKLISDDIVEVDPAGVEVARTHLWRALDPLRDPIGPNVQRWEWTHLNGIDLTAEGNIVFSCRTNSRVGIVERATNKLLWRYGQPETFYQHNPTVLPNGNIQIFDNGMDRIAGLPRSRVIEVDPKNSAIVWEYTGEPPEQFFSAHVSGAERLPGGNVLICEGAAGRIFEVTSRGETVWEWINPFANRVQGRLTTLIYRAHRYAPDHPALAGRTLDPAAHAGLNRLHGL